MYGVHSVYVVLIVVKLFVFILSVETEVDFPALAVQEGSVLFCSAPLFTASYSFNCPPFFTLLNLFQNVFCTFWI